MRKANEALLQSQPLHGASLEEQFSDLRRAIKASFDSCLERDQSERLNDMECLQGRALQLLPRLRRALRADITLTPCVEELMHLLRQLRFEVQHLKRCAADQAYQAAWQDTASPKLEDSESDWSFWQQQKPLPNHPWTLIVNNNRKSLEPPVQDQLDL
jgi:hypothetical protein